MTTRWRRPDPLAAPVFVGRGSGWSVMFGPGRRRLQPRTALHDAAVGEDGRGREVAGSGPGQKGAHAADLFRLCHAPEGDGVVEFLEGGGIVEGGRVDRGIDR